jgi:hypothetical protein
MIRKGWQLIALLIVLGAIFEIFVQEMRRQMPWIIGGLFTILALYLLIRLVRYFRWRNDEF